MTGKYAANTEVSSDRSRMEIEKTLRRYGASQFAYMTSAEKAMIAFVIDDKQIRFVLPLPDMDDFQYTATGRERSETSQMTEWEKAGRQRWRALALVIKAKLEAVECGISVFEDEFMANIVLPDGRTVSQFMLPQIKRAYELGEPPQLLLEG